VKAPPNSFYEDQTKIVQEKENHPSLFLMNIDTKTLNKILANKIQQYVIKGAR
jgi:hypothetical protein